MVIDRGGCGAHVEPLGGWRGEELRRWALRGGAVVLSPARLMRLQQVVGAPHCWGSVVGGAMSGDAQRCAAMRQAWDLHLTDAHTISCRLASVHPCRRVSAAAVASAHLALMLR